MKSEDISSVTSQTGYGDHPRSNAYFDGHHFSLTTPTRVSPTYYIKKDGTTVYTITAYDNVDYATYGVPLPIMTITNSVLLIACPYYDGSNYQIRVYKYTNHTTVTMFSNYSDASYMDVVDVMYHNSMPTVLRQKWITSQFYGKYAYWTNSTTNAEYGPNIGMGAQGAKGGYYDGSTYSYFLIHYSGDTVVFKSAVASVDTNVEYTVTSTEILDKDGDYQWLYNNNGTWFVFDWQNSALYRGKLDANLFSKILAGKCGLWVDNGITQLVGTEARFWKLFYNGGIERYETTKSGISCISAISNHGFKYDTSYVTTTQSSYTPLQEEWVHEFQLEAPTYEIHTAESYSTYLHLYDDSSNAIFIGHVKKVEKSVDTPTVKVFYESIINSDLNRRITVSFTNDTKLDIVTGICAAGATILKAGSIADTGSYSLEMTNTTIREALMYLYGITKELPIWTPDGEITFEDGTNDSALNVGTSNIIEFRDYREESVNFGSVILVGDGVTVQSIVSNGGDDTYYDYYPYESERSKLQTMADNIADTIANQINKITVLVSDAGLLTLGNYTDVAYTVGTLDINTTYNIIGLDYKPYNDSSVLYLTSAMYIKGQKQTDAQVERNTARINSIEDGGLPATPTTHASTHGDGGSDEITITESQISDLDHYDNTDFDNQLATKTTSDLAEGTNLYYTAARVDTKIATHAGIVDAHHVKYTDAEVEAIINAEIVNGQSIDNAIDALILTHKNIAGAHHTKYLDSEAIAAVEGEATLDLSGTLTLGTPLADAYVANDISLDSITQITARSHTDLSDIGTNTHVQIDTFMAKEGQPDGLATLDAIGWLDDEQIPGYLVTGLQYIDVWAADAGTYPSAGDFGYTEFPNGAFFVVYVAGTVNNIAYVEGDSIIWDEVNQEWDKIAANDGAFRGYLVDAVRGQFRSIYSKNAEIRGKRPWEYHNVLNFSNELSDANLPSGWSKTGTGTITYKTTQDSFEKVAEIATASGSYYSYVLDATASLSTGMQVDAYAWAPTNNSQTISYYFYGSGIVCVCYFQADASGYWKITNQEGANVNVVTTNVSPSSPHQLSARCYRTTGNWILKTYIDGVLWNTQATSVSGTITNMFCQMLTYSTSQKLYLCSIGSPLTHTSYNFFGNEDKGDEGNFSIADSVTIDNILDSGDTFADSDSKLMTAAAIEDRITLGNLGVTATSTELNIMDGVTASTTEINKLDGLLPTTTELNYVDGVTSSIQDQLDERTFTGSGNSGKFPCSIGYASTMTAIQQMGVIIRNTGSTNVWVNYKCPIPIDRADGKSFHCTGVYVGITAASSGNEITRCGVYNLTGYNTETTLYSNTSITDGDSAKMWNRTWTAVDCSGGHGLEVNLYFTCTTASLLQVKQVYLTGYYA